MLNIVAVEGVVAYLPRTGVTKEGIVWYTFYIRCERNHKMKNGDTVHDFVRVHAYNDIARVCRDRIMIGRKVTIQGSLCSYTEEIKGKKYNMHFVNLVAFTVDTTRESWSIIPLQTVALDKYEAQEGAAIDGLEGW